MWGGVGVKRLGDRRAWWGRTRVSARSNTEAKQATGNKQGVGGAVEHRLSLGSGALPSPCGRERLWGLNLHPQELETKVPQVS